MNKTMLGNVTVAETISSHQNNYTLIRTILASAVIYFHSFGLTHSGPLYFDKITDVLWPITTTGGLAVQAFFFLSGLFVAQSFFNDQSVIRYTVRRVFRIFPALIVCVIVTTVVSVIIGSPNSIAYFLSQPYFYDFIFSNSLLHLQWQLPGVFESHRSPVINGPIHTLPPELKMYALLGFVGFIGLIKTKRRLASVYIVMLILFMFDPVLKALPFIFNMDYTRYPVSMFVAGVVVFCFADKLRLHWMQGSLALPAAWLAYKLPFGGTLLFYGSVIWFVLYIGQLKLLNRLSTKSDLSYGIYLYGWPATQMVASVDTSMNPYYMSIFALTIATVFAWVSWNLIEKPCINSAKKMVKADLFTNGIVSAVRASSPAILFFVYLASIYALSRIL